MPNSASDDATINSSKTFYILTSGNPNNDWDKEVVQN